MWYILLPHFFVCNASPSRNAKPPLSYAHGCNMYSKKTFLASSLHILLKTQLHDTSNSRVGFLGSTIHADVATAQGGGGPSIGLSDGNIQLLQDAAGGEDLEAQLSVGLGRLEARPAWVPGTRFLDAADVQTGDAELERGCLNVIGPGAAAVADGVEAVFFFILLLGQVGDGLLADQTLDPGGDAVEFVLDLQRSVSLAPGLDAGLVEDLDRQDLLAIYQSSPAYATSHYFQGYLHFQ